MEYGTIFKNKGIDSIKIKELVDSLSIQFNRLVIVAEKSPELLDNALYQFERQLIDFNSKINQNLTYSMSYLSSEREIISEQFLKERMKIDSIILRERKAILNEASILSTNLLDRSMQHINELITTAFFYILLFFIAMISLPFIIGYYTGKSFYKNDKADKESI